MDCRIDPSRRAPRRCGLRRSRPSFPRCEGGMRGIGVGAGPGWREGSRQGPLSGGSADLPRASPPSRCGTLHTRLRARACSHARLPRSAAAAAALVIRPWCASWDYACVLLLFLLLPHAASAVAPSRACRLPLLLPALPRPRRTSTTERGMLHLHQQQHLPPHRLQPTSVIERGNSEWP